MREREDALRSMRRFVFNALGGPPWRVRLAMDGRFKRPFALVSTPTPGAVQQAGPSAVRQDLPVIVQLYPALPGDGPSRATEARLLAERAAELLTQAIGVGVADLEDPTVHGYQQRIPLWDYHDAEGTPLVLDGPDSVAVQRLRPDYLWVADGWTVHVQPEASEDQLFVALANLRVQWYRSSRLRPQGELLQSVQIDAGPAA
jgi:hypothetical protein